MKEKEEAIEMERNWADLPLQLFPLILKKLPEICDFVRSRAVCKSWRFSTSVSDLSPQFPWILKLSNGPDLEFYSIASNKVYTIYAPISFGYRFFVPAGSYMLTGRRGYSNTFSLLNPLNNSVVPLPDFYDMDPCHFSKNFSWFSPPPNFQIDNYVLFTEYERWVRSKLRNRCFARGNGSWEDYFDPEPMIDCRRFYFKGLLFMVEDSTGVTKIIDISSRKELHVIPPPKDEEMSFPGPFLVDACGEILAVYYRHSHNRAVYKFRIHRLEFGNGERNPCWVKLSSIGDQTLFFDFYLGIGRGFGLRASNFAGFKGKCIYITNEVCPRYHVINMYDIENGETVFIDSPFHKEEKIAWFMPTIDNV